MEGLLEKTETSKKQLEGAKELHAALEQIAAWQQTISRLHSALELKNYPSAASAHLDSVKFLETLEQTCDGASVLSILREDTSTGGSLLEARCEEGLADSLIICESGLEIRDREALDGILSVLRLLGPGPTKHHLAPFSRGLLKHILIPLIERKAAVQTDDGKLSVSPSDGEEGGITELYISLFDLFSFLRTEVFSSNPEFFCGIVGEAVWNDLARAIVEGWLEPLVPERAGDLGTFAGVQTETEDFMKALDAEGFVVVDEGRFGGLLDFCRDVETRFMDRKRASVLGRARKLVLSAKHSDVRVELPKEEQIVLPVPDSVGTNDDVPAARKPTFQISESDLHHSFFLPLFPPPPCTISSLSPELLELVSSLLSEASEAPTAQTAADLVRLAMAIPRLYRAIKTPEEAPGLAARMHNDCMHLASGVESLGVRWRSAVRRGPDGAGQDDPERAKIIVSFAAEAEELRRLGRKVFNSMLCTQRDELVSSLSSSGGFEMAEEPRESEVSRAIRQALHLLGRLGRVWRDMLPANLLMHSLGLLAGRACEVAVDEIQSLRDIGADESGRMNRVLVMLRDGIVAVFRDAVEGVEQPEGAERGDAEELALRYTPPLKKLTLLAKIMDSAFARIMEMFRAGELRVFKLGELTGLMRAIFADTALRQKNLDEILRGHPGEK